MIRDLLKFVVILLVVCLSIGGGVACLYASLRARIAERDLQAKRDAIEAVCPDGAAADTANPLAGRPFAPDAVYAARDGQGTPAAYVAAGEATGYSSVVKVMVGVRADTFAVVRVVVLDQQETPGLGANVAETRSSYNLWQKLFGAAQAEKRFNPFLDQFVDKQPDRFGEIDAMTAATITSNATKAAVRQAIDRIRTAARQSHE